MGMIINGEWHEVDNIHHANQYQRPVSNYHTNTELEGIISDAQRYCLIGSFSCPWSHRTLIYRHLLGLEGHIPLHMTGGKKVQGYSANHGQPWKIPGTYEQTRERAEINTDNTITHLHELYKFNDANYTGRSTVPILWDSKALKIISNESTNIIEILKKAGAKLNPQNTNKLEPPENIQLSELSDFNAEIYDHLSNGVYKAAFAKDQQAYDEAVEKVFKMLASLEERLHHSRFLLGDHPCHADWLLLPTLVRFDIDYYLHSGCCHKQLRDYPKLWHYARRLYNYQGIAQTVNFEAIHASNYFSSQVKPLMPKLDWTLSSKEIRSIKY